MNPRVLTVRENISVRELAAFLTENEITGAPVVNSVGKMVGVVSVTDIADSIAEGAEVTMGGRKNPWRKDELRGRASPDELRSMHVDNPGPPVQQIMTPTVFTVPAKTPVSKIAQTMISGRIHRLFVTRLGRIVGIVTALDLLKLLVKMK